VRGAKCLYPAPTAETKQTSGNPNRICEWARHHYEQEKKKAGGRHAFICGDGQKEQAEAIDLMDKIFDA